MSDHHHMAAAGHHLFQAVQQPGKVLLDVGVALAVADVLDAFHLQPPADRSHAELFGPVGGVQHQGLTVHPAGGRGGHLLGQHLPAGRGGQTPHVQPLGAALGVDEHRAGKPGGQAGFADALHPVQYHLDRGRNGAAGNREVIHDVLLSQQSPDGAGLRL